MKISKNQIITFRNQIITLLILGLIFSPFILNYSGFCFAKGRHLTFDEKITAIFNIRNNGIDLIGHLPNVKGNGSEQDFIDVKYIPYSSFEEFTKLNPNCCSISYARGSGDMLGNDFWERIFGYDTGEFITMNFKYRYFYKNEYTVKNVQSENVLTNCGRVRY